MSGNNRHFVRNVNTTLIASKFTAEKTIICVLICITVKLMAHCKNRHWHAATISIDRQPISSFRTCLLIGSLADRSPLALKEPV